MEDLFNLQTAEFNDTDITGDPDRQSSAGHLACFPILASPDGPYHLVYRDGLLLERNHNKEVLSKVGMFRVLAGMVL